MICRFTLIRRLTSKVKGPRARQERFRAIYCRLPYERLLELEKANMQRVLEKYRWKKQPKVTRPSPVVIEMDAWRKPGV